MAVRTRIAFFAPLVVIVALLGWRTHAQTAPAPTNDAPNPYTTVPDYFKLPAGRVWGSTSAVEVDKDGRTIWIAERCGANSCITDPATGQYSPLDPILHFDASGKLIKAFGAGMFSAPHGIHVDRDGNVWITDYQDNAPRAARGAAPGGAGAAGAGAAAGGRGRAAGATGGAAAAGGAPAGQAVAAARGRATGPAGPAPGATKGHQIFKFSPDGKLLLTLGKAGGAPEPDCCFAPNDVLVAPNGDIFVSEGHGAGNNIIFKFDKTGKLLKQWGKLGTGPGEFDQPHSLAMDSKGRLFVGDRNNNRVQIFDQNGTFLDQWLQFSRPSGVYIDKKDMIYVADSESMSVSRNHDGWKRGIRVGSVKDGKVIAFIPDPDEKATGTSAAEGVVADSQGNIYGAEVGPRAVKRYVKK
jgi:DNA-binding beta-propeller fold protein YncE